MTNDVTQPAVIGGDGIGPEVTEQALHVLEQTVGSDAFATHEYHLGAAHWKASEGWGDDAVAITQLRCVPRSMPRPVAATRCSLSMQLNIAGSRNWVV